MMCVLAVLVTAIIIALDQLTKMYIVANFTLGVGTTPLIKGLFNIVYVENTGAAWGLLSNYTWLLIAITIIIMVVCFAMLVKHGMSSKLLVTGMVFVLAGGLSNLFDRVVRGRVVDFIQFDFWRSFPIFNIADVFVCLGAALLFLYFVIDMVNDHKAKKELTLINEEVKVISNIEQENDENN